MINGWGKCEGAYEKWIAQQALIDKVNFIIGKVGERYRILLVDEAGKRKMLGVSFKSLEEAKNWCIQIDTTENGGDSENFNLGALDGYVHQQWERARSMGQRSANT